MSWKLCLVASLGVSLTAFAAPSKVEKALASTKAHEECMTLEPNQELTYAFKATTDLKFNLHYHEGKNVVFPIKEDKISKHSGTFKPKSKQDYCLMWANKSDKDATVTYEFEVK